MVKLQKRYESGLYATDVDAVSIDVILPVLILGLFTITYPFYAHFILLIQIAQVDDVRNDVLTSVIRLGTGHVSNKYVTERL